MVDKISFRIIGNINGDKEETLLVYGVVQVSDICLKLAPVPSTRHKEDTYMAILAQDKAMYALVTHPSCVRSLRGGRSSLSVVISIPRGFHIESKENLKENDLSGPRWRYPRLKSPTDILLWIREEFANLYTKKNSEGVYKYDIEIFDISRETIVNRMNQRFILKPGDTSDVKMIEGEEVATICLSHQDNRILMANPHYPELNSCGGLIIAENGASAPGMKKLNLTGPYRFPDLPEKQPQVVKSSEQPATYNKEDIGEQALMLQTVNAKMESNEGKSPSIKIPLTDSTRQGIAIAMESEPYGSIGKDKRDIKHVDEKQREIPCEEINNKNKNPQKARRLLLPQKEKKSGRKLLMPKKEKEEEKPIKMPRAVKWFGLAILSIIGLFVVFFIICLISVLTSEEMDSQVIKSDKVQVCGMDSYAEASILDSTNYLIVKND